VRMLRSAYAFSLTRREVMALVVSGLLNKQVGGELASARSRSRRTRSDDAQDEGQTLCPSWSPWPQDLASDLREKV